MMDALLTFGTVERSKLSVKIRLAMMELKVSLILLRLISSRALGTTERQSDSPSASMSARRGATTVVLPAWGVAVGV